MANVTPVRKPPLFGLGEDAIATPSGPPYKGRDYLELEADLLIDIRRCARDLEYGVSRATYFITAFRKNLEAKVTTYQITVRVIEAEERVDGGDDELSQLKQKFLDQVRSLKNVKLQLETISINWVHETEKEFDGRRKDVGRWLHYHYLLLQLMTRVRQAVKDARLERNQEELARAEALRSSAIYKHLLNGPD